MQSGPFCDRPVYHIEMRDVKKKFSGLFAGKVPYKLLIKFAAVFARPLDPVLACLKVYTSVRPSFFFALRTVVTSGGRFHRLFSSIHKKYLLRA
jgi:hypothetical protein